jgi:prepilin-type processing-associated H-X9-DG protein
MPKLENVQITSYQLGVLDNGTDGEATFVFAPQTSQSNGDGDVDGRDFLVWQRNSGASDHPGGANFLFGDGSVRVLDGQDDPNLLLPAVSDPNLLLPYTDYDIA